MNKNTIHDKVVEAVNFVQQRIHSQPKLSITLGTGMYSLIDLIEDPIEIDYKDIPHFPTSTVQSHTGKLIFGRLSGKEVVLVAGRFHYYEGYSMKEVTFYIHLLKALGIELSILTNAAGGLNPHFKEGDLVIIEDHINLFSSNPLRGQNDETFGPRFPDLLHAYPKDLIKGMLQIAKELNIDLKQGVYLGWQGPSLETPAEYKMAHLLGADLVGMSTIPEVIVNKYRNIQTIAFSIVSNVCFPISTINETTVDDVIKVVNLNAVKLQKLILTYIKNSTNL